MSFLRVLKEHTIEFSTLDGSEKICLIGSWIAASGAALLIGSTACTLHSWISGKEPINEVKHALAIGFGMSVGGGLFTIGAAMEDDRISELESDKMWKQIYERRAAREASPCPNCKYFSGSSDLYCALNPGIACTPDADNCKDFESKETN